MRYMGIQANKLPIYRRKARIYRNKITNTPAGEIKQTQWHLIFEETRYVITASYFVKTKKIEISHGKKRERIRNKKLSDPSAFPINFQHRELASKFSVGYDFEKSTFTLLVNCEPFINLPYQAEVILIGPQIIEQE